MSKYDQPEWKKPRRNPNKVMKFLSDYWYFILAAGIVLATLALV